MKKKTLFFGSALLLAFASCQNEPEVFDGVDDKTFDQEESVVPEGLTSCKFGVSFDGSQTRTLIDGLSVSWVLGDSLGIYCGGVEGNTQNVKFELNGSGANAEIKSVGEMLWLFDSNTFVYGYYPYDKVQNSNIVRFTLPASQVQIDKDAKQLSQYDYLVATPVACSEPQNVNLSFNHIMTWLDFVLTNTDDRALTVNSVDMRDASGRLVQAATVNVAARVGATDYLTVTPIQNTTQLSVSAPEGWAVLQPNESITLRMAVFPGDMTNIGLNFVANTSLGEFSLAKAGRSLEKGLRYNVRIPLFFPYLDVENAQLNFAADAGTQTISFETNLDWTVEGNIPAWVTLDKTSGSKSSIITVTTQENVSKDGRVANLTLKAGSIEQTITINQGSKDSSGSANGGANVPGQGEGGDL